MRQLNGYPTIKSKKIYEVSAGLGISILNSPQDNFNSFGSFFFQKYDSKIDKTLFYAYDTRDCALQIFEDYFEAMQWCTRRP